jgi:hypothetical protein
MMMSLVDRFTYAASNKGLADGTTTDDMNALKYLDEG